MPKVYNRERGNGDTTAGSGIHSPETAATGLHPIPSHIQSQGNLSRVGTPSRFAVHSREDRGSPAVPSRSGNHGPEDRSSGGILRRLGTHRLVDRAQRDVPNGWGIRSQEEQCNSAAQVRSGIQRPVERSNPEHLSSLDIHIPVMGRAGVPGLDNRKQGSRNPEIRRRGNRNKCRAAVEV